MFNFQCIFRIFFIHSIWRTLISKPEFDLGGVVAVTKKVITKAGDVTPNIILADLAHFQIYWSRWMSGSGRSLSFLMYLPIYYKLSHVSQFCRRPPPINKGDVTDVTPA